MLYLQKTFMVPTAPEKITACNSLTRGVLGNAGKKLASFLEGQEKQHSKPSQAEKGKAGKRAKAKATGEAA